LSEHKASSPDEAFLFAAFSIGVDTSAKLMSPEIRDGKLLLKLSKTVRVGRPGTKQNKK